LQQIVLMGFVQESQTEYEEEEDDDEYNIDRYVIKP
jgi:hypothetical protein